MATWRYECRDCDERTPWLCRADAEAARYRHHDTHHAGRAPAHEGFLPDARAERVNPLNVVLLLASLLALAVATRIADFLG
ncbi:MAG TPA: hypothetical protein VFY14_03980 [Streptomyces sp.]|nr:hypothetical protein [Streptomyces sp.]